MADYREGLRRVIEHVVAPSALHIDRDGTYPCEGISALGEAGILGLTVSSSLGGGGGGLAEAAEVVQALSGVCGSTAMVTMMHFAGTALIEKHGPEDVRRAIGEGRHLTTLAFSERGSRSQFWAPMSTAKAMDDAVQLDAEKSWVTSAKHADSYVWSSRPLEADGPMTLWLVPAGSSGLTSEGSFDGFGLRGNGSTPMVASGVVVPAGSMLGEDGTGLALALSEVLPWFLVMSAAFSVGIMKTVTAITGEHITATRLDHLEQSLVEQPMIRHDHALMQVGTDRAEALLSDTLAALGAGRDDATLRVLEVKAVAGEEALYVTDLAMKVCGGAAFRKDVGIERHFRDARAARVMAPTTDALLDFIARTINGLPLL